MTWQLTDDLDRYVAAAGVLLGRDPVRHTLGLTVVADAQARDEPLDPPELYGWWTEPDGEVTGACSHTPPYPLAVEAAPGRAARALVDRLVSDWPRPTPPPGVNAPSDLAVELAARWAAAAGGRATLTWAQRLFVLDRLSPPDPAPPGAARPATAADRELVAAWGAGFAESVGARDPAPLVDSVLRRLTAGGVLLWCLPDGTPVSMAGRNRPAAGAVRVGPVYTPAEQRGRGYAAAVTAAATAAGQAEAEHVVLFTDLANPTSNALYPRLGYRPVTDRAVFGFERRD